MSDETINGMVETIEQLENELEKYKWIPVSERLPDKNGNYIISLEDTVDPSARFFNGKWFMSSIDAIAREYGKYEVVAWMPLPEPYKESEEEQMQTFGFCVYHEIECDYKGLCIECPHNTKEDKEWFEEDEKKERDTE